MANVTTGPAFFIKIPKRGDDGAKHGSFTEIGGDYISLSQAGTVRIIFDKFFEYDDGNGNPIYDENSGRILRDPVTGQPS
jgi:hypothetical protein